MPRILLSVLFLAGAFLGSPIGVLADPPSWVFSPFPPESLQRSRPTLHPWAMGGELGRFGLATFGAPPAAVPPGEDFTAWAFTTPLFQKHFITHWLTHPVVLQGKIDEDKVGEAGIDGRCSDQPMTDNPASPTLSTEYWWDPEGRVATTSAQVYYEIASNPASDCKVYDYTDLTRYFVTWVYAPTARTGEVWVGAHDHFKLWINRALVLQHASGGAKPYTVDEYKAPVNLQQGWNLLVFKQSFPQLGPADSPNPDHRTKYFSLRFVTGSAGTPMRDLQAAFDPHCTDTGPGEMASRTRVWVPNIARLAGAGGSQWNSVFSVFNGLHMPVRLLLRYYKEGNNSASPNANRELVVEPLRTEIFDNALSSLFNVTSAQKGYFIGFGQFYLVNGYWGSPFRWVTMQVYNQAPTGRFAMDVPILYQGDASLSPALFFAVPGDSARINLAMVPVLNAGSRTSIRVSLFPDGSSTVLRKTYGPFNGFFQVNDVLNDMGLPPALAGKVTVQVELVDNASGTPYFSYITINDGIPSQGKPGTSDPLLRLPSSYIFPPQ